MFLPWYQQNAVVRASTTGPLVSRNLSAFAVFSFVEAVVLLLAGAVIALLFARAERRPLRLPASDGALIMGAGGWIGLLLVYRLFEKPGISSHGVAANVGIQWGIFFALLCAGLLIHAGSRMRSQHPPLLLNAARLSDGKLQRAATPPGPVRVPDLARGARGPPHLRLRGRARARAGEERRDPTPDVFEDGGARTARDEREDATRDARANPARTTPDAHAEATRLLPVGGSRAGRDRTASAADERLWQLSFEEQSTDDTARLPGKPD